MNQDTKKTRNLLSTFERK